MKPLNGTTTHPLSNYTRLILLQLVQAPLPTSEINPGVVNRLLRENLAEEVQLPSPFKVHKGGTCSHLQITDAGRAKA